MSECKLKTGFLASALSRPGRHGDGGGLTLIVGKEGTGKWVYRYTAPDTGRVAEMGLGSFRDVAAPEARDRRNEARKLVKQGINPVAQKRQRKLDKKREAAVLGATFRAVMLQVVAAKKGKWRSERHHKEFVWSLETYAAPLMHMPVSTIAKADITAAMLAKLPKKHSKAGQPLWLALPETAKRTLNRIETILGAAKAHDLRTGDNPAQWKDFLEFVLPNVARKAEHHAMMPYADLPAFFLKLGELHRPSALALEFLILTAARAGEVFGALWSEIDLDTAVWTVPAKRMKAGTEHQVPLSKPALAVLAEAEHWRPEASKRRLGDHVFPGRERGKPLAGTMMSNNFKILGATGCTVHGMRATFKTWCGDVAGVDRELAEHALAHKFGNSVEQAYQRGSALEKRRALMEAWGLHCTSGRTTMEQDNEQAAAGHRDGDHEETFAKSVAKSGGKQR